MSLVSGRRGGLAVALALGLAIWVSPKAAETSDQDGGRRPMNQKGEEMSDEELRQKLTPEQYRVTRQDGTERPFQNEYWDNHEEGIYVDLVSGEPLFSSRDKFESGTGWPSFTRPIVDENVVEKQDRKLFMLRTEVRSQKGDSHLGHLFPDGPAPTGLRYCVNSAALRFIPVEELEENGYGDLLGLFEGETAD